MPVILTGLLSALSAIGMKILMHAMSKEVLETIIIELLEFASKKWGANSKIDEKVIQLIKDALAD